MTAEAPDRVAIPTPSFNLGIRVALACNGLLLISLYSVVSYQRDIRARIPVLLGNFSPTTWVAFFVVTILVGLLGLVITRAWSRAAALGAVAGGFLSLMILSSRVLNRLIPADYESSPKWIWFAAAIVVAGFTLWRVRAGRLTRA